MNEDRDWKKGLTKRMSVSKLAPNISQKICAYIAFTLDQACRDALGLGRLGVTLPEN